MTAARIDPNELTPANPAGAATGVPTFYDDVIATVNNHADLIDAGAGGITGIAAGGTGIAVTGPSSAKVVTQINTMGPVFNVKDTTYGAVGDGSTDDRAAIQSAINAAISAGGGVVFFPPGTYNVSRNGSNSYSLTMSLPSNVTLSGVRGQSWIRHPTGMPNASVAILFIDRGADNAIRDLGFDGNWGNPVTTVAKASTDTALPTATVNVASTAGFPASGSALVLTSAGVQTVTYTGVTATTFTGCSGGTGTMMLAYPVALQSSASGLNHTTQADPKNYNIFCRGTKNLQIQNCKFRQAYGDFIWLGTSNIDTTLWCMNIGIQNCDGDISARNAVTFGQGVIGATVRGCKWTNIRAQAIDAEPVIFGVRDIIIDGNYLDGWWDKEAVQPQPVSIVGGASTSAFALPGGAASNWRVVNNTIMGVSYIEYAHDIVFANNRVVCDWATGVTKSAVQVMLGGSDISIVGNSIYSRAAGSNLEGQADMGCITVFNYASVAKIFNPATVRIYRNRIKARNARHGINLVAPGGQIQGESNTASSVTSTTLVRTGAGWTTDQWGGCKVRIGTSQAAVISNTTDTLTLATPDTSVSSAWQTELGNYAPVPATLTYTITRPTGVVDVAENDIDCTDDGNGKGGSAIRVTTGGSPPLQGQRVRIRNNKIRNGNTSGIVVVWTLSATYAHVEIADNFGHDDQPSPTMTNLITYSGSLVPPTKWIMRGNITGEGVTNVVSGLSSGAWILTDGGTQEWAGYGSPEAVVSAPVGSIYRRVDGAAGSIVYDKTSGTGNTGWRAVPGGTETKTTGALTPTIQTTLITTSGTVAYTLADGDATIDGMVKKFVVITAASTPAGTLTPTHLADGSTHTITWSATCSFELMWDQTNTTWRVVGTPRNATVN